MKHKAEVNGIAVEVKPVISAETEEKLETVFSNPHSYVSTSGCQWRSTEEIQRMCTSPNSSHLIVNIDRQLSGAVSWFTGQSPGYVRLTLTALRDDLWSAPVVAKVLEWAVLFIVRGTDAQRIELQVPCYSQPLLEFLLDFELFELEGVLADAYYANGKFWNGLMCRARLDSVPLIDEPRVSAKTITQIYEQAVQNIREAAG